MLVEDRVQIIEQNDLMMRKQIQYKEEINEDRKHIMTRL